jgi:hypothetical protein
MSTIATRKENAANTRTAANDSFAEASLIYDACKVGSTDASDASDDTDAPYRQGASASR